MLDQAQSGRYAIESLAEISLDRRRAHFLRGYGEFQGIVEVKPELRQMIEFRRINLHDREWGLNARFDAIFCRNVIIYFDRAFQEHVVQRLASHLKPQGYFFSGHSENLQANRGLLAPVGPTTYRLADRGAGA